MLLLSCEAGTAARPTCCHSSSSGSRNLSLRRVYPARFLSLKGSAEGLNFKNSSNTLFATVHVRTCGAAPGSTNDCDPDLSGGDSTKVGALGDPLAAAWAWPCLPRPQSSARVVPPLREALARSLQAVTTTATQAFGHGPVRISDQEPAYLLRIESAQDGSGHPTMPPCRSPWGLGRVFNLGASGVS